MVGRVFVRSILGGCAATLTALVLASCATDIWLIPKDEKPFTWPGYYPTRAYGDEFPAEFVKHYEVIDKREHFDLWGCRNRSW